MISNSSIGQGEQGAVAAAFPAAGVGRGQQGAGFCGGEERDLCAVEAFLRDGQDLRVELGVLGVAQCRVAEQRAHRVQVEGIRTTRYRKPGRSGTAARSVTPGALRD